ncbi:WD40 repeat [Kalmanozyma brasiliensis GHG001]|uniref:WD40 repeat n=1 Tax=Kalmanozyma brasiliensis (strain GHG001) TaxID=1365824 RepID=UPI001CE9936E|nr:WD40 repeat [Kalmanozyma brasiliensis GHG001]KAF6767050.1 WD40 repeat [Kalmanozyma brasiliensis GHG001]
MKSSTSYRLDNPTSSPTGLFSGQSTRQTNAGLVDSVSSLATTATNATAKAKPKILHGREVIELEFSEGVRGIYATSVHAINPAQDESARKGKGRASSEKTKSPRFCVVLVVVLASKAIVFELSPPPMAKNLGGNVPKSAWTVRKRTSVQTFQNRKGLGSVAPYYDGSAAGSAQQAAAIVAVPGRQKGHVQLLTIKLQSLTMVNAAPVLSNSASSVGAASIIVAHESSIAAITLSPDGRWLATASSKGTLVRIWANNVSGSQRDLAAAQGRKPDTPGRTGFGARLIRELRRGTDTASILSIAFTPDASMVAAASDKGTIHIFLLADPSPAAEVSSDDWGNASTSTSSRKANLGRAAAQYLPSGLGSLASQIPSSVYPQYLKSEWSSAQFRIPLRSFGASSRHYTAPSAADNSGFDSAGSAPAAPTGTEKSTEGAWAQMRSRISDIRKGEASVDESVFLCWVAEGSDPSVLEPSLLDKGSKAAKDRSRSTQKPGYTSDTSIDRNNSPARHHLIALTTSGGWYKLAVTLPQAEAEDTVSGSTVLDMYRRDASSRSKHANALECRLVEFRPMAALLDSWRA